MTVLKTGLGIAMLTMLIGCDQGNDSEAMRAVEETEVITNEVMDDTAEALDSAGEMVEEAVDMAKETAEEMGQEIAQEAEEKAEEKRKELVQQAEEALGDGEGEIDSVLQGLKN